MQKISANDLAKELVKAYTSYTEDVIEGMEALADEISKDTLADVKRDSPKRTGDYAKGFRRVKRKLSQGFEYEIWNPKHYRRVHLLEKGWTARNGRRVAGKAHMAPAEVNAVKRFEKGTQQLIKEGGS